MARPLRIEYEGAWYHVTCRGNERLPIFRLDRDRERFLRALRQSAESYNVQIHCFVLMLNHFHLLLRTLDANLSRFMQRFNTAYTTYFNIKHARAGHLYQGRFKAILVEADAYLLELSRYIHLNPVRRKEYDGLPLEEKIKILDNYRWSSYPGYASTRKRLEFIHYTEVLAYMGGDNKKGRRRYRDFVLSGLTKSLDNPLENTRAGIILAGHDFFDWVERTFLNERPIKPADYERSSELIDSVPSNEIARLVADEYGVSPEVILQRRSPFAEARKMLIALSCQLNLRKKNMRQLGEELGGISSIQVSRTRREFERYMQANANVAERYNRLIQTLETL